MMKTNKKALIAASVAGLMAMAPSAISTVQAAEAVPCYGINACKGTGDCGGKGYSCAGKNACKGQGFIQLPAETCSRIEGGKLTAE